MTSIERTEILRINRQAWNQVAPQYYGGTALPEYGPLADTEDDLHLIENLRNSAVLELGCGSGHSLLYLHEHREAGELWGLDLSPEQIRLASETLGRHGVLAKLITSSMDENPGIPENHFDWIVSIYGLGWTPDLPHTLSLVHSYLKPGGVLLFSWEHPVYRCLSYDPPSQEYLFSQPYRLEGPENQPNWKGVRAVHQLRTLSTYLNAVIHAGFALEQLVESDLNLKVAKERQFSPDRWYTVPRAQRMPTTFIVKARKWQ
jgi:ubiquinone/menaquinone biosynthesis C-methylase UbiE